MAWGRLLTTCLKNSNKMNTKINNLGWLPNTMKQISEWSNMTPEIRERNGKIATIMIISGLACGCLVYSGKQLIKTLKDGFIIKKRNEADCLLEDAKGKRNVVETKAKADAEVQVIEAKARAEILLMAAKKQLKEEEDRESTADDNTNVVPEEFSRDKYKDWLDSFRRVHQLPTAYPDIMRQVIDATPNGYEEAMMLNFLQGMGAIGYSRVRALYLDKELHSPNIQAICEAISGGGKQKFWTMFQKLFAPIINRDKEKINKMDLDRDNGIVSEYIIQTAGIGISEAKLNDILAGNKGAHFTMVETEISAVTRHMKKPGGLTYEHLRKAFSSEEVYRNTKSRDGKNGAYPVYFNYFFTGTHNEVENFINKNIEGGNANRICWCGIPRCGKDIPVLHLPEGKELLRIQKRIEELNRRYCVYTDEAGQDNVRPTKQVNMDYVCNALKRWLDQQYDLAKLHNCQMRNEIRARIAAIAFHCAIVLHMLYNEPTSERKDLCRQVVELTLYIANYCMERYLHKFCPIPYPIEDCMSIPTPKEWQQDIADQVPIETITVQEEPTILGIPFNIVEQMANDYVPGEFGYGQIAKKYNIFNGKNELDRTKVCRIIKEYNEQKSNTIR